MNKTFIIHFKNGMTKEINENTADKIKEHLFKRSDFIFESTHESEFISYINLLEIVYIEEKIETDLEKEIQNNGVIIFDKENIIDKIKKTKICYGKDGVKNEIILYTIDEELVIKLKKMQDKI